MANKPLHSITFPGLSDKYVIPDITSIAPAYSASSSYAVGDLVSYDNKIYKCTTAIPTHEAWTAAHWSQTNMAESAATDKTLTQRDKAADAQAVGEEITALKGDLSKSITVDTIVAFTVADIGIVKYFDGDTQTSSLYSYTDYIDVSEYNSIEYKRPKSATENPYTGMAFYTESRQYISGVQCASSQTDVGYESNLYSVMVPDNAKYARFSVYTDTSQYGEFIAYGKKMVNIIASDLNENIKGSRLEISKTVGYYIDLTATPVDINTPIASVTGMAYSIISCEFGDRFSVNAIGGGQGRAWGFLDSDNSVIIMANENVTVSDFELIAPENAVKLIINDKGGLTSYRIGKNLISVVDDLGTKIDSGLSSDVKDALLNCFKHVAWTDGHSQDYYDALEEALYGNLPEIKVFLGKGISGSSIVDRTDRALSEPIPFENVIPITMQLADNVGYVWQPRMLTSQHSIPVSIVGVDSNGIVRNTCRMQPVVDGYWTGGSDEKTLSSSPETGSLPVRVQDTDGTLRLLFANGTDQTADLPPNPPSGLFYIGNKKYKLIVGNNEDFV